MGETPVDCPERVAVALIEGALLPLVWDTRLGSDPLGSIVFCVSLCEGIEATPDDLVGITRVPEGDVLPEEVPDIGIAVAEELWDCPVPAETLASVWVLGDMPGTEVCTIGPALKLIDEPIVVFALPGVMAVETPTMVDPEAGIGTKVPDVAPAFEPPPC